MFYKACTVVHLCIASSSNNIIHIQNYLLQYRQSVLSDKNVFRGNSSVTSIEQIYLLRLTCNFGLNIVNVVFCYCEFIALFTRFSCLSLMSATSEQMLTFIYFFVNFLFLFLLIYLT